MYVLNFPSFQNFISIYGQNSVKILKKIGVLGGTGLNYILPTHVEQLLAIMCPIILKIMPVGAYNASIILKTYYAQNYAGLNYLTLLTCTCTHTHVYTLTCTHTNTHTWTRV